MTEDQVLLGLGLIVVPAVGSQVPAHRLRIPALIVLLPVGPDLTGPELARRHARGARVVTHRFDGTPPAGHRMLFLVRGDGRLLPVTRAGGPAPRPGDLAVLLSA
ncbi:hypothetical protein ACFV4T_01825 [Streptomyces sp. NPDC059755]|uniref:hypothetical protein n=1 Tax=Streptomyces sp. NPDC059755 TaxID=3346934 RepID=UPI0036684DAE